MANTSIYAAFERMWAHVVNALSAKSDTDHTHDDMAIIDLEDNAEITTTETYLQEQVNTLNQKFSNEENTSITTIDEFKEYLIDRVDGSCFGIFAVSNCEVVFGVTDTIMGTVTAYNGNFVFDAISHWNSYRWHGRFTSYDDTWEIKEEADQSDIDELNTKNEYTVYFNSYCVGTASVCVKAGIAYVNVAAYFTNDYGEGTWKSIASGFPTPLNNTPVANANGYAEITTDGILQIYDAVSKEDYIAFSCSYPIS